MPYQTDVAVTYSHIRRAHAYHRKRISDLAAFSEVSVDTLKGYYRKRRDGPLPDTDQAKKIVSSLQNLGFVFKEDDQVEFFPKLGG